MYKELKKEQIEDFYESKDSWKVEEIIEFEKRIWEIYTEDEDFYHEANGFNDAGYDDEFIGVWQANAKKCDSCGGLDASWVIDLENEQILFNKELMDKVLGEKETK